ncbi:MAG TPA: methyltransferase domain-containing protein [Actinophytocola sp.]|uniref:class I SAM-dependent methyltransferase n=1 Tax=Actinophytocola sp. TaxID=1872138 RepID=UPI002DDD58BF|nr:methyltransferase domain-containing protein [Actinophytocola sp.]HEV2783512.1 methyltransferase domain-containing protein [Actinophytocola sp.]
MVTDQTATDLFRAWADDLAAWRIPERILTAVDESPWVLPDEVFARRADRQLAHPGGPSHARAIAVLPNRGSVIDVGAGGGAASLPLAPAMTRLTAIDANRSLLADLARRAAPLCLELATVHGRWPDVADRVPDADLVVCHHVLYDVADLAPFLLALTGHARRRVVVEITARHPLTALNPFWQEFHGLPRPTGPTADDVLGLLRSLGLDAKSERWTRPAVAEYKSFSTLVDVTRRRLCLPPNRAADVAAALHRHGITERKPPDLGSSGERLVTIWWPGQAR